MKPTPELPEQLSRQMWESGVLADNDHVLVAVSGGADSMALLTLLLDCRPALRVSVAHFDHKLRDDSHRDREHVERHCAEINVACHVGEDDVRAWARYHGESIEAAARRLRYEFLEKTADDVGADKIATAHTLDDHVETLLMRILRGSGIRGLAGIPPRRGRIVRPLLSARRRDILDYCAHTSVSFVDDPSNRDTRFERNYIRHEVLPSLATGFPDAEAGLLGVGVQASQALNAIRRVTDPILDGHLVEESPGIWVMATAPLARLDDISRYVLFGDALSYRLGHQRELGRAHHEALSKLVTGPAVSRSLPGLTVRREHGHLVFYCGGVPTPGHNGTAVTLDLPGQATLSRRVFESRTVPTRGDNNASWQATAKGSLESGSELTAAVAYFALEHVTPPFIIRPVAPGDRMRPFGMGGHQKKLSDVFIDRKIPLRCRSNVLVVADQHQVIWVPGVTTSDTTRITHDTSEAIELRLGIE